MANGETANRVDHETDRRSALSRGQGRGVLGPGPARVRGTGISLGCQGLRCSVPRVTGAACSVTTRYRPHGEGSATGAEEHALALESAWSRNAYGARHTEDLYEVMRSVENRVGTITSLRWTEDGAWVLLRTSRIRPVTTGPTEQWYPTTSRMAHTHHQCQGTGTCHTWNRKIIDKSDSAARIRRSHLDK